MKSSNSITNWKQTASFRIASLMLAIAPLWMMLARARASGYAQMSPDISTTSMPSPSDWTQFHRDNMQRRNPYETVPGVNHIARVFGLLLTC
jgi:hypothetical protein